MPIRTLSMSRIVHTLTSTKWVTMGGLFSTPSRLRCTLWLDRGNNGRRNERRVRLMLIAGRLIRLLAIGLSFAAVVASAQNSVVMMPTDVDRYIDPEIAAAISATRAIDNHAHPVLPPPDDRSDRNFDALPVDNMEPETDPIAWRPD